MWNLISTRVTQFAYFDQMLDGPAWKRSRVLDFGGNVGGFLVGAANHVDHNNYWCLDLNQEAVEQGRRNYPGAHFMHYDRYSSQFNPNGVRHLPIPDPGLKFEIILAFSVFTHTHRTEMLELVGQLRGMLAPRGVLAFTFTDPRYDRSLSDPGLRAGTDVRKILEWLQADNPALEIDDKVAAACKSNWCLLVGDKLHVEPGPEVCNQERLGTAGESYNSYFTADYMATLFPEGKVRPPVSPEWQHCCILRSE